MKINNYKAKDSIHFVPTETVRGQGMFQNKDSICERPSSCLDVLAFPFRLIGRFFAWLFCCSKNKTLVYRKQGG